MNSVRFGEKDSYADWGLILKPKARPLASPKTNTISIEGKDGDLDLTTALTGDVKYNNVSYSLEFTLTDERENWESRIQEITTYLHGKRMNVIFSEDADWYYIGRMSVDELSGGTGLGIIKVKCDFEPYKLKVEETIINETIVADKIIKLPNARKWVMPTFEVSDGGSVNFIFEDKKYSCSGTLKTPNIILKEGGSEITLTGGSGTLKITYREGKL